jgi:hypothetical protein
VLNVEDVFLGTGVIFEYETWGDTNHLSSMYCNLQIRIYIGNVVHIGHLFRLSINVERDVNRRRTVRIKHCTYLNISFDQSFSFP